MVTYKEEKQPALAQEFLTRAPLAPERQMHASSPAWLYTALLGNGSILGCLDETGEIGQLFYPHIDIGPHVRSFLTGVQVTESTPAQKGTAHDVCWFADEAWTHSLTHVEQAAVVRVISRNT